MRRLTGIALATMVAWIGIEAIATKSTWLWGSASSAGGVGGLTADYMVRGTLAVIMGVGWLFAAVSAGVGVAAPDALRTTRLGYAITSVSLLVFAACFVYVAGRSVVSTYFPVLL